MFTIALSFFFGVLTWSFLEYVIHRWAGHDRRTRPNLFANEHTRHHSEGNYFAPAYKKVLSAAVAVLVLAPPAILVADWDAGFAYVGGFVGFYLMYEWLHYREHIHSGIGPYGRWARRHHFYHHFVDPRANHGVTSPIWDLAFGTYRRSSNVVIRVPEKLKMHWLTDPASGDVCAEHRSHYALVRRKPSSRPAAQAA